MALSVFIGYISFRIRAQVEGLQGVDMSCFDSWGSGLRVLSLGCM